MVLARHSVVLGFVLLGSCSESLFGAHPGGQGGPGDDAGGGTDSGVVPATCPDLCIGNAGTDFDGSTGGKSGYWRYLDDHRDRSWAPMAVAATVMTGADPGNHITTCAANPTSPACNMLSEALLVSTAGSQSNADPAIEFTTPRNQAIQLSLRALVPSGADQTIRLYRNSREDVLFTGTATAGTPLAHAITLDALAGDRFLVAVAPTNSGAMDIGLQLFVSAPPGAKFGSICQIAVPFETTSVDGFTTNDGCHGVMFTNRIPDGSPDALSFVKGPFMQQGNAANLRAEDRLDASAILDYSGDVTVQFWFLLTQFSGTNPATLFSDRDVALGGGLAITLVPDAPAAIHALAGNSQPTKFTDVTGPYSDNASWQFVRVVRSRGNLSLCLQGRLLAKASTSTGNPITKQGVFLGLDTDPANAGAFEGQFDDVRVITGALPCDPSP